MRRVACRCGVQPDTHARRRRLARTDHARRRMRQARARARRASLREGSAPEKTKPPEHHAPVAPRAAWPSVKIRQRGVDAPRYCEADARWTQSAVAHSRAASGPAAVPFAEGVSTPVHSVLCEGRKPYVNCEGRRLTE